MIRCAVLSVVLVMSGAVPAGAAPRLVPAHSHWDGFNSDYEVEFGLTVRSAAAGAGPTIAYIPFRERDAKNYMELDVTRTGLVLKRRVAGVSTTVAPSLSTPHTWGVGSAVEVDFVYRGATLTASAVTGGVRGATWYTWTDPTYLSGVNISYYTQPRWSTVWTYVDGHPTGGAEGSAHRITNLEQDATNHPAAGSEATFDDPAPASGGAVMTGPGVLGLPSGKDYTYRFTVTGTSGGTVDVRDPGAIGNSRFWQAGWLRFTTGDPATLRRYTGAGTLAGTVTAPFGGPGVYLLRFAGAAASLTKAGAAGAAVSDGNNTSGLRVRVRPVAGQIIDWAGTVG